MSREGGKRERKGGRGEMERNNLYLSIFPAGGNSTALHVQLLRNSGKSEEYILFYRLDQKTVHLLSWEYSDPA